MKQQLILLFVISCLASLSINAQSHPETGEKLAHTFSIVAMDPLSGEMAVGVQSHWFSVGSIVSWGSSGKGVVATQSFVNPAYGPDGLKIMASGKSATESLELLVEADDGRDFRQVAMLDANGDVAVYTGKKCIESAAHYQGKNFSVQANMMISDQVVPAMAKTFEAHTDLPLAERVVLALQAGQDAGGDIRGRQSAALIVVGPDVTTNAWEDKKVDLRVEDHKYPVMELSRLLKTHRAYEHMNRGDLAVEHGDMRMALEEYDAALSLLPDMLEMRYWKAVALANNDRLEEAGPIFQSVFKEDPNWRELTIRLPASGLLSVSETELAEILAL